MGISMDDNTALSQLEGLADRLGMAGLDPAVYQSGKHDGQGRMTKRGNRHLRGGSYTSTTKKQILDKMLSSSAFLKLPSFFHWSSKMLKRRRQSGRRSTDRA